MAKPKHYYITLDTETATLPFVNEMDLTASQKKNIAIAKPLVYDIGWIITDRNGEIFKKEHFLVQETFFVPNVFNTAYYKDKRPIYMQMLKEGKIQKAEWNTIIEKLLYDLRNCHLSVAYNACFDFKKSIPFRYVLCFLLTLAIARYVFIERGINDKARYKYPIAFGYSPIFSL